MKLLNEEQTLSLASAKSGMDEKTARKYRCLGKLPSEVSKKHSWRTREDSFAEIWEEVRSKLDVNSGLQAKTLFKDLQRRHPGQYQDGQLRTLQRRVKQWRALEGPPKEVFFEQRHEPGELCQSDFTNMNKLGVRIQGQPFDHLIYHFVMTYSNWEWGTVCFSESFESLSVGFQSAVWKLGGVPKDHRTDRLSAAVHKEIHPEVFTQRYESLLAHYGVEGRRIQVSKPNENGDVEQRHYRLKEAVDQTLMLRGTIRVDGNTYSVDSRLIGEDVEVRVHADELQVWYAQGQVDTLPRLRGSRKHRIQYRHIIDWLIRKPGAFENYRYREELFPTTRFRMAYDQLRQHFTSSRASKDYLQILQYAARLSESAVNTVLGQLLRSGELPTLGAVEVLLQLSETPPLEDVHIDEVELTAYDHLLDGEEEVVQC